MVFQPKITTFGRCRTCFGYVFFRLCFILIHGMFSSIIADDEPFMMTSSAVTAIASPYMLYNPAAIYAIDSTTFGLMGTPSRFGLSELAEGGIYGVFAPTSTMRAALNIHGFGHALYAETGLAGTVALAITDDVSAGIRADLRYITIRSFASRLAVQWDAGMQFQLSPSLRGSMLLTNITRTRRNDTEPLQMAQCGLGWQADSTLCLEADIVLRLQYSGCFLVAASYKPYASVGIRTAWMTQPQSMELALAIMPLLRTHMLIAARYTAVLGIMPSFGLAWSP